VQTLQCRVSISCAAALERFPLVLRTCIHCYSQQLRPFCSFLHLFMHKMCKSEAQLTGCSLQLFYSRNSTTTSSSCYRKNCDSQICSTKEDSP
jgi:hypothetical protein